MLPYDDNGRFVTRKCPDPDCEGFLVIDQWITAAVRQWRCNGLVAKGDWPLTACTHEHTDGDPFLSADVDPFNKRPEPES